MKFEQKTIDILKSFTGVNPAMMFMPGNELRVMTPTKTVIAKATITESFEKQFAIENVPQFLNVLSLFESYDVEFQDNVIVVKGEGRIVKYNYTALALVKEVKNVKIPGEPVVEFKLTQDVLNKSLKALGILGLDHLVVVGSQGKLLIRGEADKEGAKGNHHDIEVGETEQTFNAVFKAEYLRLYPGDYNVEIYRVGEIVISKFIGPVVEYVVAVEAEKSKFE